MERIQKLIARSGLCSRRKAEELILAGRVTVNGKTVTLGESAEESDLVRVDGAPLTLQKERTVILLNKPAGYVTTMRDEKGRRCVAELVRDVPARVYPVGRLDMYSEGLLVITDDGELANTLEHPSHRVEKEYLVRVEGEQSDRAEALEGPIELDGTKVRAKVRVLSSDSASTLMSVTITEGKNRQIRRMCDLCGLHVLKLKRIREGELSLGDLRPGKWRPLSEAELGYINNLK